MDESARSSLDRRSFLRLSAVAPLLAPAVARAADPFNGIAPVRERRVVRSFAFGSCAEQDRSQPIWDTISGFRPAFYAAIGDNIYADTEDMSLMAHKYAQLGALPEWQRFRRNVGVLATWDDHDFGINDGGKEYPKKEESKKLMLDFFNEPQSSERRKRPGVYTSYMLGPQGKRLQVIMMDLRWFRDPIHWDDKFGGYVPTTDTTTTMLGPQQWAWLENELRKPADLRVLASSTQFIPMEHQWEKWNNFPHERARMLNLFDKLAVRNLFVISGDMHYGELSMDKTPGGFEVFDLTSSGLNLVEPSANIPNSKRLAVHDTTPNFGFVEIDWGRTGVGVSLQVKSDSGETVISRSVRYS